jgi:hypothetical protein
MQFPAFLKFKSKLFIVISIGLIFASFWLIIELQIQDYKKRLKIAQLHLQSVEEVESIKQMLDSRESLINDINLGKVPPAGLLKLISAVIPPSTILNELNFDQSSQILQLRGVVMTSKDLAAQALNEFRDGLGNSKFIRETSLINSQDEQGLSHFEIEAKLAQ